MPRIRQLPKSEANEKTKAVYDRMFNGRDPLKEPGTATGSPGNFLTVIAQVPWILDHFLHLAPITGAAGDNPSVLDI